MMNSYKKQCHFVLLLIFFTFLSVSVKADTLTDLKNFLGSLKAKQPLTASLHATNWRKQGKGKNVVEKNGEATIQLHHNTEGLQVFYGKDMLALMDIEASNKIENKKVETPTLNIMDEFKLKNLHSLMSSSSGLLRAINEAGFINEEEKEYKGKIRKALNFKIPIESMEEQDRKYIKKFSHHLTILTNEKGHPIASQRRINVRGRAFIVIKFKSEIETEEEYIIKGDRLITVRKSYQSSGSGGGEASENRSLETLEIQ